MGNGPDVVLRGITEVMTSGRAFESCKSYRLLNHAIQLFANDLLFLRDAVNEAVWFGM
jgi:hypothetical protein